MSNRPLYCSFCGKSQHDVFMIAGPTAFICADCIALCADFCAEHRRKSVEEADREYLSWATDRGRAELAVVGRAGS